MFVCWGRLWAALGLTGVYSGCVMIGDPPLLVSGLASNYFRIRALLSTPDFGLRVLLINYYSYFLLATC